MSAAVGSLDAEGGEIIAKAGFGENSDFRILRALRIFRTTTFISN